MNKISLYIRDSYKEMMQKVTWPSWEELKGSTALIMIMITLLGSFIVLVDLLLMKIFFNR